MSVVVLDLGKSRMRIVSRSGAGSGQGGVRLRQARGGAADAGAGQELFGHYGMGGVTFNGHRKESGASVNIVYRWREL